MSIKEGDMVSIRQDFIRRQLFGRLSSYWGGLTEGGKESTWRKCE